MRCLVGRAIYNLSGLPADQLPELPIVVRGACSCSQKFMVGLWALALQSAST
jgi:hypothetical protein